MSTLTATHPPLEQRLDQLARIAANLGQTALGMGLWDVLRGQSRPRQANLDALFGLPSAALTLEASLGLHPTGVGLGLLPRGRGQAAAATQREAADLVPSTVDPPPRAGSTSTATPGSRCAPHPTTSASLVTDLHAVNSALEVQGFGTGLLCSTRRFPRRRRTADVPRLPLQAGHLLPVLPDRPDESRHAQGAPGPRRDRGRPADRAGHRPLDADLGDR